MRKAGRAFSSQMVMANVPERVVAGGAPSALGNPVPDHRLLVTIPGGPRRLTDDGERERFYIACGDSPAHRVLLPKLRECRKILVVKLDFIGDWVLTTPFLANLRRSAPRAEITAVVLDRAYELASACRLVDRCHLGRPSRARSSLFCRRDGG